MIEPEKKIKNVKKATEKNLQNEISKTKKK